jgi:2-polyprenyl-3-methyl-5-hydroxy-6-metoxy-1,4-benzoquinol methylase
VADLRVYLGNLLVKLLGWKVAVIFGDSLMFDRWKYLQPRLRPGPGRTLDAGCGSGAFALYAATLGNEAIGISFDENDMIKARTRAHLSGMDRVKFITGDLRFLDSFSEELGSFDQIICFETIEHILDDDKLIKDLSHLLTQKGKIYLTTPYKFYHDLPGDKVSAVEDGGHVRKGYTHQEMKDLFNKYGLKVIEEEYISGFISQKIKHVSLLMQPYLNHNLIWIITYPLRAFLFIDRALTNMIKYPYLSIGVVAVKT